MIDDRHAEHARVLERATHQQCGRNRPAIVGKRDAPGMSLFAELGELLAFRSDRHRADRIHARATRLGGLLQNELGDAGVIVHRLGVRHARDRGEPAGDRRCGSGRDRLLVLLARFAEVHVDVDQPGRHDPAALHFEHVRAVRRAGPFPIRATAPSSISMSNSPSRPLAGSTTRPPLRISLHSLQCSSIASHRLAAGQQIQHRHSHGDAIRRPARESRKTGRRRPRNQFRRRGSSGPGCITMASLARAPHAARESARTS